jgi:hypothetical protein
MSSQHVSAPCVKPVRSGGSRICNYINAIEESLAGGIRRSAGKRQGSREQRNSDALVNQQDVGDGRLSSNGLREVENFQKLRMIGPSETLGKLLDD